MLQPGSIRSQPIRRDGQPTGEDAFDQWLTKYTQPKHEARNEDYVVHDQRKDDGHIH